MSKEARFLFLATFLLVSIGVVMVYSSSAVLAHDSPTMNEYIAHRRNGWLFPSIRPPLWRERLHASARRRWPHLVPPVKFGAVVGR